MLLSRVGAVWGSCVDKRRQARVRRLVVALQASALPSSAPTASVVRQAAVTLACVLAQPERDAQALVRTALRHGSRAAELDNDDRARLATMVLGCCVLRARLDYLLRSAGANSAEAAGEEYARLLVALYLLHEAPASWTPVDVGALGLRAETLSALRASSPALLSWPADAAESLAAKRSLPLWLAAAFVRRFGDDGADALGAQLNAVGPVTLRVNSAKASVGAVADLLSSAGANTMPGRYAPDALRLTAGRPPLGCWSLPGWQAGLWEVQDEGSQLIALATRAQPGETVLDYCAGNGGKTLALASMMHSTGCILCCDISQRRLAALAASSQRVGVAHCVHVCLDVAALAVAVAASPVDCLLVDAPCSSTGALRRRPHARWTPGFEAEAAAAPQTQRMLMSQAAEMQPARLVYATCSLLAEENEEVRAWFDATYGTQYQPWPFDAADPGPQAGPAAHERTMLPHIHGTDGFYVARWRRVVSSVDK